MNIRHGGAGDGNVEVLKREHLDVVEIPVVVVVGTSAVENAELEVGATHVCGVDHLGDGAKGIGGEGLGPGLVPGAAAIGGGGDAQRGVAFVVVEHVLKRNHDTVHSRQVDDRGDETRNAAELGAPIQVKLVGLSTSVVGTRNAPVVGASSNDAPTRRNGGAVERLFKLGGACLCHGCCGKQQGECK